MYQRRVSTVPWSLFNDIELPGVHHACNAMKLFASRGRSLTLHPRWVKPPSTPLPLSFSLSLSPRDPFHSSLFPLCCVKFDIELFFTVITLTSRRRRRDRCNAVPMVARGVCIFEILTRLQGCTRRTGIRRFSLPRFSFASFILSARDCVENEIGVEFLLL